MSEQNKQVITQETQEGLDMFWEDKPKELPSLLSGFTPAPDVLIKKYGFVTALVWGRIWRYCQMADGVCRAKLETIGAEIGMSERTIIRHADLLCGDGFLLDTTPELKNRPHIYADPGKLRIRISVEATLTESQGTLTLSHSRVTESQREGDRESLEESIKKQKKKVIKKGAGSDQPKATDIPELVLYREVVKHWPKPFQRETVIQAVRNITTRLGRAATQDDLSPFWNAWGGVSGNEWSLVWLTEWAVPGRVPQRANGKTPVSSPTPPPATTSPEELERLRAEMDAMFARGEL